MKLCKLVILFAFIVISRQYAHANNIAAGDFYYEWQSDSTYRFFLKLYVDCSGDPAPNSVPMCLQNSCNSSLNFSTTLIKYSNTPVTVNVGCSKVKTICDSPASNIPGYREWIYTATVTLPAQCNAWHIFAYASSRNNSVNISNPTSGNFYTEISFNNAGSFQGNSSARLNDKPIYYAGVNMPFACNPGVTDLNGDSVAIELIDPRTGISSCSGTPGNVGYVTTSPAISLPSNPFQTNNTFRLSDTGYTTFLPSMLGKNSVCLKVKEYRNHNLIGYTLREEQFYIMVPKPYRSPNIYLPMHVFCLGKPAQIRAYAKGDSDSRLFLSYFSNPFSNGTSSITGQNTDSVSLNFAFVPTSTDIGQKSFLVTVTDSTCNPPGYVVQHTSFTSIQIPGPLKVTNDTTLCLGDTIALDAEYGEFTYNWQVLKGSVNDNDGCVTCSRLVVFPKTESSYIVTSQGKVCGVDYSDTVNIHIRTANEHPGISITVYPDTTIDPNQRVTFTANVTDCMNPRYQWRIYNQDIPGANSSSFTVTNLEDNNQISCRLMCADTCPDPRYSLSNIFTMHVGSSINQVIKPKLFRIYPNPNNGSFTITGNINSSTAELEIFNTLGKTVYRNTFTTSNHTLNQALDLDLNPGMYLLRINGQTQTFVVTSGK